MGDPDYIWREVGCPKWAQNLTETGYFQKSLANGGNYTPKSGDLIFFRWSPEKAIGHIGIVLYSDGERVYTVEGNTNGGSTMVSNGGGVHFKSYALDYSCIEGYGTPPYKTDDEVAKIDYSGFLDGHYNGIKNIVMEYILVYIPYDLSEEKLDTLLTNTIYF